MTDPAYIEEIRKRVRTHATTGRKTNVLYVFDDRSTLLAAYDAQAVTVWNEAIEAMGEAIGDVLRHLGPDIGPHDFANQFVRSLDKKLLALKRPVAPAEKE